MENLSQFSLHEAVLRVPETLPFACPHPPVQKSPPGALLTLPGVARGHGDSVKLSASLSVPQEVGRNPSISPVLFSISTDWLMLQKGVHLNTEIFKF